VRDDPAVAAAATNLVAVSPDERPAALLRRARAALAGARKLRAEMGGPFGGAWPPAEERLLAYCELATRDLDELLATHPHAPEAAEALFTLGQVNDFPLLNRFDDALAAYRQTVERYPDTPWGRQARERIAVIEGNLAPATRGGGAPGN
jgi:hypothetical protein